MSDEEQHHEARRVEHHRRAQSHAIAWAEQATAEYNEAIRCEDEARRNSRSVYMRDSVAEDRRLAQFHGARSTEALKLANMWVSVARALADGNLPAPGHTLTRSDAQAVGDPGADRILPRRPRGVPN